MNLIMQLYILSIKLNIELLKLPSALRLEFSDDFIIILIHFSSVVSVARADFHNFEIFRESFNIVR